MKWLDDAGRDVAYAIRTLTRSRAFTATAVVTLALGIGAVTVIYSVVRNVLLDPFPYAHSQRMVDVLVRDASNRILRGPLPGPEFLDFQEQSQVFEDVAGAITEGMHLTGEGGTERVSVGWLTPNSFTFLGVSALFGRHFGPEDARPDAPPVAVLNHRTWMTLFGGDRGVIGRTVVLNGQPRTVIGVMPPRFEWHVADFWLPADITRTGDPKAPNYARWFQARLRRGVTVEEAAAQMNVIAARRAKTLPAEYPERSRVQVITVIDWVVGQFRGVLYTLLGAVGLLLLIACANVINMLLARGIAREREISVRAALGASRGRIVRQLLIESTVLASAGALGGVLLANAGIAALARVMPRQGVAWEVQLRLDLPVLVFTLAVAGLATLLFGLFPALHGARRELIAGANAGARGGSSGRSQTTMRNTVVVAEIALSIVLLLGAGLLVRSFVKLIGADLGMDPRNLLVAGVSLPPTADPATAYPQFFRDVVERLARVPGIQTAAVTSGVPPFGGMRTDVSLPGAPAPSPTAGILVFCSANFLDTMGLRVRSGRGLTAADVEGARKVAVVNETFAARYFGGANPVGQVVRAMRLGTLSTPTDPSLEIIGVVPDTANQGLRESPIPQLYLPYPLRGPGPLTLIMRTSANPARLATAVKEEIQAANRNMAVVQLTTLEETIQMAFLAQPRFSLIVLVMFASTGLVLVALGIYGVLAYTVSQRSREIAIRVALGGERRHVLGHVVGMGLRLLAIGVIVGLACGIGTNRLLASQLWQTSPYDPLTLGAVAALVIGIGLCACWIPARRAVRIEPIAALRHE